jgi:RNA polymerase-associated protein
MRQTLPNGAVVIANLRAEVPALIGGNLSGFERSVILEYLNEKFSSPSLFSNDSAKKADMPLTWEVVLTQYEALNWAIGELRAFERSGYED